ncbi:MAG: hybrid sensor histidine kinase/response regulator [Thermoleophilia bacterium]|jgi:two-component system chemotaxis sensor kinase CheA
MDDWANDREFLQTFRAEAEERLKNLTEGFMALEEAPGNEEMIKSLFREAHTLKGSAGMMGLVAIKELAHKTEDILASVQNGQVELNQEVTSLMLESLDRIHVLLPSQDEQSKSEPDVSDLLVRLQNVAANTTPGEVTHATDAPSNSEAAGDLNIPPADDPGDLQIPEISATESSKATPPIYVPAEKPAFSQKKTDPTIRVNIERLDKLLNLMGEILVNQIDTEGQVKELSTIQFKTKELRSIFSSLVEQADQLKSGAGPEELASFSEKLNQALDEATGVADHLESTASHLKENTASRRLALDELQDRTLHVRMLPLDSILGLYPRIVRDASASGAKKVKLAIEGEETELDKRILEQISDPLMHIIRNCVDHGIEIPAVRASGGKPEQGTVKITASQHGDRVEIEIEDDGAGIDVGKLKETARRKGVISEDDDLTDEEAMDLIFRPGFSTAQSVTDISGRGVGLDVVKNNIEKLEGSVSLESTPGRGSRFTVSLPVTLAVISGLLVECNNEKFVIPLGSVKEMVALKAEDIQTIGNHKGFLIRDNAIPLLDLLEFLGGGKTEQGKEKANVVIVGSDRHMVGLHVDRLLGEQEVVIKPLGRFLERRNSVAGVTILGNGEVVVVLNVNEIVHNLREGDRIQAKREPKQQAKSNEQKKSVLVVEDSLVVRELQRNILEAAGYEVRTAVDGEDALARLSQESVDCVVTDVEMPRMNGFDLTSKIKKTEELTVIPVIIVTSCSSDQDMKKGIEVGADAYVVKGTFNQQKLLDTIERLVA